MKPLLLLLFISFCISADAKNYYFSSLGNDSNDGTIESPWKTLIKFNKEFSSASPGDKFFFKCGDTFYGNIIFTQSGTTDAPITIGSYGKGQLPVITGFTSVKGWRNLGNNIWESVAPVSTLSTCNMVSINGVNTAMGRTPNYPNYYTWKSHTGNTSISTLLSGTPNWTGAELAIFTTSYRVARHPITSQSDGIIYFSSSNDLWQNAPGFFFQQFQIQNDIRTLDTLNEWYYNPSIKKIDIYNTSTPAVVMIATVDNLVFTNNQSYIIMRDLALTGANGDGVSITASSDIKILNCNISYIGGTAIYGMTGGVKRMGLRIDSNKIFQVNNSGIDLKYWYAGDTIRYNTLKNINMLIGMQNVQHTIIGQVAVISSQSDDAVVSYNDIDNVGNLGINFFGNNVRIDHNFVNHACNGNAIRDGGAIYTWNGSYKKTTGNKVFNNIVMNTGYYSEGIYCDEGTNGVEIYNNTSYSVLRGIYISDSYNINVHDNTTFNTNIAGVGAGLFMNNNPGSPKLRNIVIKGNKFIAKTPEDRSLWIITTDSASMPQPFISDSNYFAKPIGDNINNIQTYLKGASYIHRTFSDWQALNGQDKHSKQSPIAIKDTGDLRFEYNSTNSPITISLPYNYIDITGASYKGSVTILPYSSWVGIKNSDK